MSMVVFDRVEAPKRREIGFKLGIHMHQICLIKCVHKLILSTDFVGEMCWATI